MPWDFAAIIKVPGTLYQYTDWFCPRTAIVKMPWTCIMYPVHVSIHRFVLSEEGISYSAVGLCINTRISLLEDDNS